MMNLVAVMGRMVSDPEFRHTPSGVPVTSFTLAVDRSYVKSGTERQTDFIDVVAWRGTAEFICRYFRKGQMMAVQGSLQSRNFTDKDGKKRRALEVVASEVNFTDIKRTASDSNAAADFGSNENDEGIKEDEKIASEEFVEDPNFSDEDLPF